ncbi:MAG TPA: bifunctional ornithine acetyltransferase/N-acetylglutamate synthase, partial [Firmicutes bacterium]|nr:bifunctional ornithine acetyltransferase/N-acetylglutamate synthase [Bacillota bacterium]
LKAGLSYDGGTSAAEAIMTTDTVSKQCAVRFKIGENICTVGGMCKGSGMINPNMATMLCFLSTDVNIDASSLDAALHEAVKNTFNMVYIDGDTSTNDMAEIMASGLAGNDKITAKSAGYGEFLAALKAVLLELAKMMAKDGEGATKLIECRVSGAPDEESARKISRSVVSSSLVKTAMFGADANWGRVMCALGYCGAKVDINKVKINFISDAGSINVCQNGAGVDFDEDIAKQILLRDEIIIDIKLYQGEADAVAYGCDLTYDYVKINGDYRS